MLSTLYSVGSGRDFEDLYPQPGSEAHSPSLAVPARALTPSDLVPNTHPPRGVRLPAFSSCFHSCLSETGTGGVPWAGESAQGEAGMPSFGCLGGQRLTQGGASPHLRSLGKFGILKAGGSVTCCPGWRVQLWACAEAERCVLHSGQLETAAIS